MFVYSLLDRKVKEYGNLVLAKNHEVVRRALYDGFKGSGDIREKHGEDFDLFVVGTFDEDTGKLVPQNPQLVCNLGEVLDQNGGR